MKTTHIDTPITTGPLTIPNRLVMPPMVIWQAEESGMVTPYHIKHYGSCDGFGLIIVEAVCISPEGKLADTQLGIWSDAQIEGLAMLAAAIRANGSIAGIQIHHAGLKASMRSTGGINPLAPSLPAQGDEYVDHRELTVGQIAEIREKFAMATQRAVQAGFQYIELHGAHGYLISQFLSAGYNRRKDRYGGSLENRQRFLDEVLERCRQEINAETLLTLRLGAFDSRETGFTVEEGIATAQKLERQGIALLNVSNIRGLPEAEETSPLSPLMQLAGSIRRQIDIPVIGVGGIFHPDLAAEALQSGTVDLAAVGRGAWADPAWARKALSGKGQTINQCLQCGRCLRERLAPDRCPARNRG